MKDYRVVILSLLGLICMVLTFVIDWIFILPAAIFSAIGWKLLYRKEKK